MPALPPDRPGCPNAPGGRRPLPDLAAIRLCRVPDSAPPYDEDVAAGEPGGGRLPAWPPHGAELQGRGGGRPAGLRGRGAAGHAPGPAGRAPAAPAEDRGTPAARRAAAAAPRAPPGWQSRFAQALAETLAGSRPPRQMVPWTTEEALDRIQRLGPQLASRSARGSAGCSRRCPPRT